MRKLITLLLLTLVATGCTLQIPEETIPHYTPQPQIETPEETTPPEPEILYGTFETSTDRNSWTFNATFKVAKYGKDDFDCYSSKYDGFLDILEIDILCPPQHWEMNGNGWWNEYNSTALEETYSYFDIRWNEKVKIQTTYRFDKTTGHVRSYVNGSLDRDWEPILQH